MPEKKEPSVAELELNTTFKITTDIDSIKYQNNNCKHFKNTHDGLLIRKLTTLSYYEKLKENAANYEEQFSHVIVVTQNLER